MKMALVVSSLGPGGLERLCVNMANHWSRGHEVSILSLDAGEATELFQIEKAVTVHRLGVGSRSAGFIDGVRHNLARVLALRRRLKEVSPAIAVAYGDTTNVLTLIAVIGTGIPVIAYEQTDPFRWNIGRAWTLLRRMTYPLARAVVVVNASSQRYFAFLGSAVRLIPNSICIPATLPPPVREKQICGLGRFTHEKGFDILIEAFALIQEQIPDWMLVIHGGGPLHEELVALVKKRGLGERVRLPGRVEDPFVAFQHASIFVQASRFEGFPLTLCEAMACGLAVVSFDAEWSRSIVEDHVNGRLASPADAVGLSRAILALVRDPQARERLGQEAVKIRDTLSIERVIVEWERLMGLHRLSGSGRSP